MTAALTLREYLIHLVDRIRAARDHAEDDSEYRSEFERLLPGATTEMDDLSRSDLDEETIVDFCLGLGSARRECTRTELLDVVRRIFMLTKTEAEKLLLVETFDFNCKHPGKNGLIFYSQNYFAGPNPSAEEIVRKALGD
jgi:hypothetical protein